MTSRSKVALVTGSSRGIGKGIALSLAEVGITVGVTYNKKERCAQQTVEDILDKGGRAVALQLQVEDRDSIKRTIQILKKHFGLIDILINNAAIAQEKPFATITDQDWDKMMRINLRGPFACCQEVLPDMITQKWGRIINVSSIGGQWGGYNQVHYAASKAAIINLTRSIAKLYSKYKITSNAVAIGLAKTEMSSSEIESDAGKRKIGEIPVGRTATIEEISNTVKFLCSEEASYITGQTININGGMYFG